MRIIPEILVFTPPNAVDDNNFLHLQKATFCAKEQICCSATHRHIFWQLDHWRPAGEYDSLHPAAGIGAYLSTSHRWRHLQVFAPDSSTLLSFSVTASYLSGPDTWTPFSSVASPGTMTVSGCGPASLQATTNQQCAIRPPITFAVSPNYQSRLRMVFDLGATRDLGRMLLGTVGLDGRVRMPQCARFCTLDCSETHGPTLLHAR